MFSFLHINRVNHGNPLKTHKHTTIVVGHHSGGVIIAPRLSTLQCDTVTGTIECVPRFLNFGYVKARSNMVIKALENVTIDDLKDTGHHITIECPLNLLIKSGSGVVFTNAQVVNVPEAIALNHLEPERLKILTFGPRILSSLRDYPNILSMDLVFNGEFTKRTLSHPILKYLTVRGSMVSQVPCLEVVDCPNLETVFCRGGQYLVLRRLSLVNLTLGTYYDRQNPRVRVYGCHIEQFSIYYPPLAEVDNQFLFMRRVFVLDMNLVSSEGEGKEVVKLFDERMARCSDEEE